MKCVHVFSDPTWNSLSARKAQWKLGRWPLPPRKAWQSSTHFVSLSLLDGEMRGPSSAELWSKE